MNGSLNAAVLNGVVLNGGLVLVPYRIVVSLDGSTITRLPGQADARYATVTRLGPGKGSIARLPGQVDPDRSTLQPYTVEVP